MITITPFLKNLFGQKRINLREVSYFLCKSAKSDSYVETLGKHADSLHNWIKESYVEVFVDAFLQEVQLAVRKLRISVPDIVIDFTDEVFYGKTRNLYTINCKKDRGYNAKFVYANCHLITKGKQIPLMCLPVRLGSHATQTIKLLRICLNLFSRIRSITFDRGFYSAEIIDFLEKNQIKYQILVPKKEGALKKHLGETAGFGVMNHELILNKHKTKKRVPTQILACKNTLNYDWLFATNIPFKSKTECVLAYKKRWQIETNFRVEDESRIKSKSCNFQIRLFYHMIGALLRMLWVLSKNSGTCVPFKKFLDNLEQDLFFDIYEIRRL